jgi:pilus assembly protein Flp/PilA
MLELIKGFFRNEEGQGLAEYALILVLIAVVVIVALTALGGEIESVFNRVTDEMKKPQQQQP